ncbi:hypothetical protein HKX48_001064 [Thoreauomyces humboldtii]|nr:hypothetical protein HKX48_001064 [Thoreauomyces humboldtii]
MSLAGKTHLTWSNLRDNLSLPEVTFPPEGEDPRSGITATGKAETAQPLPVGISVVEPTVIVTCHRCRRTVLQTAFLDHLNGCTPLPAIQPTVIEPKKAANTAANRKRKLAALTIAAEVAPPVALPPTLAPAPPPPVPVAERVVEKRLPVPPVVMEAIIPEKPVERPAKMPKPVPKPALNKGPIDLDRHCAVRTDNGILCMRSITCKIHPVGQKRNVQGRSQLYDVLVSEHQQRRPDRQPKPGDSRATTPSGRNGSGLYGRGASGGSAGDFQLIHQNLTRDEEADLVFNAIRLHRPVPLAALRGHSTVDVLLALKQRRALESAFAGRPV